MSNKVQFGKYTFRNTEACIAECKRKIRSYKHAGKIPAEDEDFFKELFKIHPDYDSKRGVGIASIEYGYDPYFGSRCLVLIRVDGTEQTISWLTCFKRPTPKHKVQIAFRALVAGDITALRARTVFSNVSCPLTGEKLGFNNSRVVYIEDLSFNELISEFLWFMDLEYRKVDVRVPRESKTGEFIVTDKVLAAKWRKYHEEMAVTTLIYDDSNLVQNTSCCA